MKQGPFQFAAELSNIYCLPPMWRIADLNRQASAWPFRFMSFIFCAKR
jgi:hypothetical protein